jgi:hypothetical protein
MLTRATASFELARQVQIGAATLGDVFSFCSGLYFRGKLAYARQFADAAPGEASAYIITPSRGLVEPHLAVGLPELREFATVPVDSDEPRFTKPLRESATKLAGFASTEFVLLGSISTGKYLDTLLPILRDRLVFPEEFASRGDMSRGALMLRAVAAKRELHYLPIINRIG